MSSIASSACSATDFAEMPCFVSHSARETPVTRAQADEPEVPGPLGNATKAGHRRGDTIALQAFPEARMAMEQMLA